MRILDRYVIRECLKILGLCLVVFMGVYLVVDLFEKLGRFLEARADAGMILRYYFFRLPKIFTEVLPVAVLLASLLSVGGMAMNNEVLAMKMGQVGALRIALPCIGIGLAASLASWITVEYIAPRGKLSHNHDGAAGCARAGPFWPGDAATGRQQRAVRKRRAGEREHEYLAWRKYLACRK